MSKRTVKKGTYGFVEGQGENILKIDTEKKRVVRLMFDLCLDGMSLGQIKDVIEAQGILYPAKYWAKDRDQRIGWHCSVFGMWKLLCGKISVLQGKKVFALHMWQI